MNQTMNKVITQRNFSSFAEDPAAASRCFQLRRSYLRTNTQLTLTNSVYNKYQQAWSSLDGVSADIARAQTEHSTVFENILRSQNDPDGSARNALGQDLVAKAESIIQTMNGRFGDNFIFAGADTLNVPFTWSAKQNPDYIDPAEADAANPDHAVAFQYMIDPAKAQNGELYTNDPELANQLPQPNPDYDEEFTLNATVDDVDDPRYGNYLTPEGKGTTNPEIANKLPEKNEAYNEDSSKVRQERRKPYQFEV